MKLLVNMVLVGLISLTLSAAWGKTPYVTEDQLQGEARRGIEEILDLWRDGKYESVYERTLAGGNQSKEQFVKTLAGASLKPACCWEKLQDVKITFKGDAAATIHGKFGLDRAGVTEFKTKSFKIQKEDGVWRMNQKDVAYLAEAKKKKEHKQRKHRIYGQ